MAYGLAIRYIREIEHSSSESELVAELEALGGDTMGALDLVYICCDLLRVACDGAQATGQLDAWGEMVKVLGDLCKLGDRLHEKYNARMTLQANIQASKKSQTVEH